jgi:hypothetical protein
MTLETVMLSVTNKPFLLSVIMLIVLMLSVVAPLKKLLEEKVFVVALSFIKIFVKNAICSSGKRCVCLP